MARVNVEQKALTDPRFGRLGLALVNTDYPEMTIDTAQCLGVGRMVKVWNACQEQYTYTLTDHDLVVLLGHRDAAKIIVESGLGERAGRGRVRIRGTDGRIEWLENRRVIGRENGKKGGRPPKGTTNPDETDVGSRNNPLGSAGETPPAPAPAPAPTSVPVPPSSEPVKKKKGAGETATKLPDDWKPPREVVDVIKAECPGLDLKREHAKFTDWAKAGGKRKHDWVATWRNWMRRAWELSKPVAQRSIQMAAEKPE